MSAELKIGRWLVSPSESILILEDNTKTIEPKAMDLLLILAEAKGELVPRSELMEKLWDGRYVTDYALNNLVASLRKHLAADTHTAEYIKTRPKKGYQLSVPIEFLNQHNTNQPRQRVKRKGDRRKKTRSQLSYWIAGVSLVSLLAVITMFWRQEQSPIQHQQSKLSIAVLPFDVFDNIEELNYFANGLAEEIIHQLTVLPKLKVLSRTSSFSFIGKQLDTTYIARQLDVAYLIEGSVRREGDIVRVTLHLINGQDGTHVWSKIFTESADQAFELQKHISHDVAHSIDNDFLGLSPSQVQLHKTSG